MNQFLTRGTMFKSAAFLIASVIAAPLLFGNCKCGHVGKGETTHWRGNQMVVTVEDRPYRRLQGTIQMFHGRPVENALVEIFDRPDYLLDRSANSNRPEQKRLGACHTGPHGKFCFRDLPSGKYELRSSVDIGWDVTHVYIVLDRTAGQAKNIHVEMVLGT